MEAEPVVCAAAAYVSDRVAAGRACVCGVAPAERPAARAEPACAGLKGRRIAVCPAVVAA